MELDMTSGKPLNTLLKFSLPLLAGSVIQNLYNIFDTAIVGHVLGKYALAAAWIVLHLYRQERPVIKTTPSAGLIVPILQLSITGIVQNGASAISMFFIQGIINTFGVNEISAYTSAYKIESILTIPAVNLGMALSVYVGQNVGAGEYDRTRQGLKDSFKIAAAFTALAMAILWLASPLLMVLVVGKEMSVIPIGVQYAAGTLFPHGLGFCVGALLWLCRCFAVQAVELCCQYR